MKKGMIPVIVIVGIIGVILILLIFVKPLVGDLRAFIKQEIFNIKPTDGYTSGETAAPFVETMTTGLSSVMTEVELCISTAVSGKKQAHVHNVAVKPTEKITYADIQQWAKDHKRQILIDELWWDEPEKKEALEPGTAYYICCDYDGEADDLRPWYVRSALSVITFGSINMADHDIYIYRTTYEKSCSAFAD